MVQHSSDEYEDSETLEMIIGFWLNTKAKSFIESTISVLRETLVPVRIQLSPVRIPTNPATFFINRFVKLIDSMAGQSLDVDFRSRLTI